MANNNQAIITIGAKLSSQTTSAFSAIANGMKAVASGMREQAKALKEIGNTKAAEAMEKSARSVSAYAGQVTKTTNAIKGMAEEEEKATKSRDRRLQKIKQTTDALNKSAKGMQKESDAALKVANDMEVASKKASIFERALKKLGRSFKTYLSYTIVAGALLKVREGFEQSTTTIIEYDQALHDLQAITQSTAAQTSQMGEKITDVATNTKFSLAEVAEGMKTLGQAGFSASESIEAIQGVSDLATGTLSDIKTTVDLVSTAIKIFEFDFFEASHVADVFANAVNGSKLTIDKLRTSFNYIGPVAKLAGVSFKDLTATMMSLANQGIRASTIGTGLRQVFSKLVKPTTDFKEAIHNSGLTLEELNPKYVDMETVISNLSLVVTNAEDAFKFFGIRGSAAISALTHGGTAEFLKMQTLVNRSGIAAEMAATQMEGLGIQFKNLRDRLGVLAKALGEAGLTKIFGLFVKAAKPVVEWLILLVENGITPAIATATAAGVAFLSLAAALKSLVILKPLTLLLVSFVKNMYAVGAASTTASAGLASVGAALSVTTIGAITAAVATLAGGIYYLSTASDRYNKTLDKKIVKQNELQASLKKTIKEVEQLEKSDLTEHAITVKKLAVVTKLVSIYPKYAREMMDAANSGGDLAAVLRDIEQNSKLVEANARLEKLYTNSPEKYRKLVSELADAQTALSDSVGITDDAKARLEADVESVNLKMQSFITSLAVAGVEATKLGGKFDLSQVASGIREKVTIQYHILLGATKEANSKLNKEMERSQLDIVSSMKDTLLKAKYFKSELTRGEVTTQDQVIIPWAFEGGWRDLLNNQKGEMLREVYAAMATLQKSAAKSYKSLNLGERATGGALREEEAKKYIALRLKIFEQTEQKIRLKEEQALAEFTTKSLEVSKAAEGKKAEAKLEAAKFSTQGIVKEATNEAASATRLANFYRSLSKEGALAGENIAKAEAAYTAESIALQKVLQAEIKATSTIQIAKRAVTTQDLKDIKSQGKLVAAETKKNIASLETEVKNGTKLIFTAKQEQIELKRKQLIKERNNNLQRQSLALSLDDEVAQGSLKELEEEREKIAEGLVKLNSEDTANYKAKVLWANKLENMEKNIALKKLQLTVDKTIDPQEKIEAEYKLALRKQTAKESNIVTQIYATKELHTIQELDLKLAELYQDRKALEYSLAVSTYNSKVALLDNWREKAKLTVQEINQIYRDANEAGVISDQEMSDKIVENSGSVVDRLKLKWKEYAAGRKSDEEAIADTMEEMGSRGVDAITDSLLELQNGTASAADSFRTFAASMLKDIQRMILRMLVMKAIGAAMNWWAGGSGGGGVSKTADYAGNAYSGYYGTPVEHGGKSSGSWGNVTRAIGDGFASVKHSGIGSDERLTIIRNNESVLTPSQMKDTSSGSVVINNNIEVPVEQSKDAGEAESFGKSVASMLEVSMTQFIVKNRRPGGLLSNA